jgi:hypothetical protein
MGYEQVKEIEPVIDSIHPIVECLCDSVTAAVIAFYNGVENNTVQFTLEVVCVIHTGCNCLAIFTSSSI